MAASKSNVLGRGDVDFDRLDSLAYHTPGEVLQDLDGNSWRYIKANTALTLGLCYFLLTGGTSAGSATAALDAVDRDSSNFTVYGPSQSVCWPQQAFGAGVYGWVKIAGPSIQASVATTIAAGVRLFSSTTAGVLGATGSGEYAVISATTVGTTSGGAAVIQIAVTGPQAYVAQVAV